MSSVWIQTITSVLVTSAVSLIGIVGLPIGERGLRKIQFYLVSFATGGLIGSAFIHLIPETFARLGHGLSSSLVLIFGIFFSFILEKWILWRHEHSLPVEHRHNGPRLSLITIALIGDSLHNFLDGLLIGASFQTSTVLGLSTTVAVILHEIPHEIGNFAILLHGGLSFRRALLFNCLSALTSLVGALIVLIAGREGADLAVWLLPFAAGSFIYLALSDLIPELNRETRPFKAFSQMVFMVAGVALMALIRYFE